jgi:hypothetical protein
MLFAHSFVGRVSIKDVIESLGVPHIEVEAIIVGQSVEFAYLVLKRCTSNPGSGRWRVWALFCPVCPRPGSPAWAS